MNQLSILCPLCGFNLALFYKINRVGCADCYNYVEKNYLNELLLCLHKKNYHVDSASKSYYFNSAKKNIGERLKEKLQLAITEERFEDAVSYQKKLDFLKGINHENSQS